MAFFFFQAEDGIRDKLVTGVQTCALPILTRHVSLRMMFGSRQTQASDQPSLSTHRQSGAFTMQQFTDSGKLLSVTSSLNHCSANCQLVVLRSEERRVGKECRYR